MVLLKRSWQRMEVFSLRYTDRPKQVYSEGEGGQVKQLRLRAAVPPRCRVQPEHLRRLGIGRSTA